MEEDDWDFELLDLPPIPPIREYTVTVFIESIEEYKPQVFPEDINFDEHD